MNGHSPDHNAKLVGGFLRMEIGLGSLVNLMLLVMSGVGIVHFLDAQAQDAAVRAAVDQKSVALMGQKFEDFETQTQAQLTAISVSMAGMPVAVAQISAVADHVHALDGRMDADERAQASLATRQSVLESRVDGIVQASPRATAAVPRAVR